MIIFLGAGASVPFGIPATRDFATEALKILSQDQNYKEFSIFFDELKKLFGNDFDLEILLTLLDDLSHDKDVMLDLISPITTRYLLSKKDPNDYIHKFDATNITKKLFAAVADFMRAKILTTANEHKQKIIDVYDNFFAALNLCTSGGGSGMVVQGVKYFFPAISAIVTTNYDTCIETFLATSDAV